MEKLPGNLGDWGSSFLFKMENSGLKDFSPKVDLSQIH